MNKKIFFVIFCIFLLTSSVSNAVPNNYNGKGSLLISKTMLDEFYDYIAGPKSKQPEIFFITEDKSKFYKKTFRNYGQKSFINGSGNIKRHKKKCEIKYKQTCYLFANARVIVWDNGSHDMKKKTSSIKYNLNKEEVISRLEKMGFEVSDIDIENIQDILVLDNNFGKE